MALATTWSLEIAKDGFSELNVKEMTWEQAPLIAVQAAHVYINVMYVSFSGKKIIFKKWMRTKH